MSATVQIIPGYGYLYKELIAVSSQLTAHSLQLTAHSDRTLSVDLLRRTVAGKEELDVVRTFGTMTRDLLDSCEWLGEAGHTHVAMEIAWAASCTNGTYFSSQYKRKLEKLGYEVSVTPKKIA
jgi:hypothetical protein